MDRLLQLRLKPSRTARYYCVVVILLSWLSTGLADLILPVKILLMVLAGIYGWCVSQPLRVLPIQTVEHRNGHWFVCIDDVLHVVDLQKNIFVGAGIIALSFQLPTSKKIRVVLWPDSAEMDGLRRLRVVLLAQ